MNVFAERAASARGGADDRAEASASETERGASAAEDHSPSALDRILDLLTQLRETLYNLVNELDNEGRDLREQTRTFDGSNNNRIDRDLGQAGEPLARRLTADYDDDAGAPRSEGLPSAREVSNAVIDQVEEPGGGNSKNASDLFWQWGQFLDHDISISKENESERTPLSVPRGDPEFDPRGTGEVEMDFKRSEAVVDEDGVRQQTNSITSFIDGSMVYGSDLETAENLRSFEGGRLRTGEGDLLPTDEEGQFLAGDERVFEQPGLASMHTLFMREHNRIADLLAERNPDWTDEQLYQEARRWVTAEIQHITYNEFLPTLLGEDALAEYEGYDENVDPRISNAFSTAAFRFGHTMVSPEVQRIGEGGEDLGALSLADAFERSSLVQDAGIEPFLRGQLAQEAQELDNQIVDPLRNMLFGPPGAGGLDLAAMNIQRGRDHGLPSFNDAREQLGLRRIESFDDPIFKDGVGEKLASVYDDVDDIDLWVGGLSERASGDAMVGDTFARIILDQFERLRAGDRFWYENQFSGAELEDIRSTTLGGVIERNTDIRGGNLDDTAMILDGDNRALS